MARVEHAAHGFKAHKEHDKDRHAESHKPERHVEGTDDGGRDR